MEWLRSSERFFKTLGVWCPQGIIMRYDVYIGVDPGTKNKTGFAVRNTVRKRNQFRMVTSGTKVAMMAEARKIVDTCMQKGLTVKMVIEDSRNDPMFGPGEKYFNTVRRQKGVAKALRAMMQWGRNVGKIDQLSEDWEELAMSLGIKYDLVKPSSRKKGITTKLTSRQFRKVTRYIEKQTNEHGRDAGMLIAYI